MSILKTLLETEESQNFLNENQDLILEKSEDVNQFVEVLKEFVIQNPDYFLENNLEDIYKNIKIFSEFATNQYISEVVAVTSRDLNLNESSEQQEQSLEEYL